MKGEDYSRSLATLVLSSILLFASCQLQPVAKSPAQNLTDNISQGQQVPTLQSGLEIPIARLPLPFSTDINKKTGGFTPIPGGGLNYSVPVEETTIYVDNDIYGPEVQYRSYIVTNAGQIHYNIIGVRKSAPKLGQTGFQVDLRITNIPDKIRFYLDRWGYAGAGGFAPWYLSILEIDIPQYIEPGDYKTDILVFLDGKYLATLPCTIQVTKY